MRKFAITAVVLAGALALVSCSSPASSGSGSTAAAKVDKVSIMVPADPGGGWDQTGRAVSQVFTDQKIVTSAPVTNVGGAGGTVGLAKLANERDPNTLMVTGLVMVGAVETNAATKRLEDTTPIARLTEEALAIVVPEASPFKTLKDVVEAIKKDGQSVTVTGGSAGGADHILAGLLLTDAGLSSSDVTSKLNYVPNSGGGEAVTLLLGGNAQVGISGIGEFAEFVKAGQMRALAVSSEGPSEILPDAPTIKDEGYNVTLTNWRGLLAPGGISDAERAGLVKAVTELHASDAWKKTLADKGWADAFLAGEEFSTFLNTNITDVTATLKTIGLVS
ncbi:Bug family tripartite tricarboxylate transporter substrate binding protein [Microbacterium sp. CJ88]|uniref:Bug family tripartite tricarboxylate transporter substrate binding protein n=1 Tax=Microbacterium sp. CJ88 TaxID=3445672 RepID=UPI003F659828